MCVIGIFDKVPKLKQLRKMEKANPHGASITWIKNGLVNYVKGEKLTSKEILRIINKENIKKDFVIHYRITSSGSTCDELCHPFIINDDGYTASPPGIYNPTEFIGFHIELILAPERDIL